MSDFWSPDLSQSALGSLLYPRLPREEGRILLADRGDASPVSLFALGQLKHPAAFPSPTGGFPADESVLGDVQQAIREVAAAVGFPAPLAGAEQSFDRPCGTALLHTMGIVPADAASEDVWTFLTLVVVPEIGPWRFPNRLEERLIGRPRNVLRRLWWRAWTLGPDLDAVPTGCTPLGEDEFVGIMERSTIGGNRRTAQAVRDAIWRLELRDTDLPRSELARQLTRRLRAFMSHVCPDALSQADLDSLLDEASDAAVAAISK